MIKGKVRRIYIYIYPSSNSQKTTTQLPKLPLQLHHRRSPTTAREKLQRAESKVWAWSSMPYATLPYATLPYATIPYATLPYATLHHTSSLLPSLASNTTQDPVQGLISVSLLPFRQRLSQISIRNHCINTHPLVSFDCPVTVSLSPKQTKKKTTKNEEKHRNKNKTPEKQRRLSIHSEVHW